ncbi:MAG: type II toxin-antitoxin system RelE/ParE family toxin [Rhizobiales bacterium]|nr:type II toxin-antitoxin system RelE/ParE family toxin [Hyphomicrobiales bacterium]
MRKREIAFSPEAQVDLIGLYDFIAERSGAGRAIGYIGRIEKYCLGFERFTERGTQRDDIRPGLRVVGFERRVTIAFHVETGRVVIDRILYGGRDVERAVTANPPS